MMSMLSANLGPTLCGNTPLNVFARHVNAAASGPTIQMESTVIGTLPSFTKPTARTMLSQRVASENTMVVHGTNNGTMTPLPVRSPCADVGQGLLEYAVIGPAWTMFCTGANRTFTIIVSRN